MAGYGQSLGQALGQFAFGSNTQDATMKGMLAGAQANQFDASAKKSLAEALKAEAEVRGLQMQEEARSPQNILRNAAQAFGIPSDDMPAVEQFIKTGKLGGGYAPSIDGMGPAMPQPDYARNLPSLVRSIGTTNRALTLGDKSVENAAKADSIGRLNSLKDDVLAGKQDATRFAQAEYAGAGSAPFSFNEYGVGNMLTGTLDDKTGPAIRFGDKRIAETKAQQANARQSDASAASSYASANNSNASAAKTNQEREQGSALAKTEGSTKGAPTGFRWKADGSLEAIPGGPAANKSDQSTEGERKAATLLKRLEGSQIQLNTALTEKPSAAKPGLGASAMRAVGAEALANSTVVSSERQRVEAAQLDMLDAALTLGTGAAYTKEQLEGYRKAYFPQIGDSVDNVRDKKVRLANVIDAAKIAAGRSAPKAEMPGYKDSQNQAQTPVSPQDQQAMDWAKSNPNDPRAAKIMQRLGGK